MAESRSVWADAEGAAAAEAERLKALEDLSDEELQMARLHLEAQAMDLYYIEGRGLGDIIEPEDVTVEAQLNEEIADILYEQTRRRLVAQAGEAKESGSSGSDSNAAPMDSDLA